MSSSAVSSSSSPAPVTRLYNDTVSSIMGFLSPRDSSCAVRTCQAWRNAAIRNSVILYGQIAQNEFTQMAKQRHIMYAPRCVRQALTTAEEASDIAIPPNYAERISNDRILDLIEEYRGKTPSEEIPPMAPFHRNPRQMYMEPYFGERAMRLAGIDPGPMPALLPTQIPNEPCPFQGQKWAVCFPETLNGETLCLDTLQKVNRNITRSNFGYYLNHISEAEKASIGRESLGLSGWYHVVVVEESRGKHFAGPGDQEEFIKSNGRGHWQIASACQAMFVEILFNASGKSLLKDDWARSPETTEAGDRLMVLGGSASRAPAVDDILHCFYVSGSGRFVVLALRKFPALGY